MSFETLKRSDLEEVAEAFGVDIADARNNAERAARIVSDGITWKQYLDYKGTIAPERKVVTSEELGVKPKDEVDAEVVVPALQPKPVLEDPEGDEILLKMERENFTFSAYGYNFSKQHPFALVDKATANRIMKSYDGFRPAMPHEAQEYYG